MNLDQLPYFVAIASYGSLSAASRQLGVSQPALSSYLAELEKSYGMPLFLRRKQRLYLTEAGKCYLKGAQDILNVAGRARGAIQMLHQPPRQELHIGVSAHTGSVMLARCVVEFMQRYPGIQLIPHEGYSYDLRQMVQNGEISLAMTGLGMEKLPDFQTVPFFRDEFVLAMPVYHPMARQASSFEDLPVADLSDFQDEVFVRSTPNTSTYHAFERLFQQAGFRPTVAVSTPNINMLTMLIRTGVGIGFLRYREDPELAYYRLKNPAFSFVAFLARPTHVFSEPERYLIYLLNKHQNPMGGIRIKTALLLDILREFGSADPQPEEAL